MKAQTALAQLALLLAEVTLERDTARAQAAELEQRIARLEELELEPSTPPTRSSQ